MQLGILSNGFIVIYISPILFYLLVYTIHAAGLFPGAFAIVESENTENWVWFLNLVREHTKHDQDVMYVYDRVGGILAAFDMIQQRPHHFICLYHLMKNLREMYPTKKYSDMHRNTMCKLLATVSYAPNKCTFNDTLRDFHALGGDISRVFMQDLPLDRWTVSHAPNLLRYGELTSNAAKSFNAWILGARSFPITLIVDTVRTQLMKWFVERPRGGMEH